MAFETVARRSSSHAPASRSRAPVQRSGSGVWLAHHSAAVPAIAAPAIHGALRRPPVWRSSASSNASIVGQRWAALGCMPRRNVSPTPRGAGAPPGQLGGPARFATTSCSTVPPNGREPTSASHSETQNAYWSVAASSSSAACCSGAMYGGVPSTMPATVTGVARPRSSGSPSRLSMPWSESPVRSARASPKSPTRARPSSPTSTLPGLKSRCSNPTAWAAASPRPAAMNTRTISRHGRSTAIHRRSVEPRTNSIATTTSVSVSSTSNTASTLGWLSCAIARASRRMRARSRSDSAAVRTVFSATSPPLR